MPLANALYETAVESLLCERYPLAIQRFKGSELVCLTHAVSPDVLFKNYPYRSGVSKTFRAHCEELANMVNELQPENVMDIGGNDGTLLRYVNAKNKIVVDPYVNLSSEALLTGVECEPQSFGVEYAMRQKPCSQDVIFTTNCFQHVLDINGFVKAVSYLLKRNGKWILEFPDYNLTNTGNYDQIYHEHIYYLTVETVNKLLQKHGMGCEEAYYINIHNGTSRMIVGKKYSMDSSYFSMRSFPKISDIIVRQNRVINLIQRTGVKIAIYGAAAKGCIMLNALGLTNKDIMYCVDDTPEKQGKYIAGTGIQILPSSELMKNKPDVVIVQAHNFFAEIERKIPPDIMTIKLF